MVAAEAKLTFAEHIGELRRRLMWSLLFVAIGAVGGYIVYDFLMELLQQPLNETLYYTTPTGAFSFIIKVCVVFGLIVALPVTLYHGFAFFEPLIKTRTKRMIIWYVLASALLACAGMTFAYFVSLPAALHFLLNFGGENIQSLITANEYFNFVLAYVAGFAVLFQLPLVLTFINRVTPLTPGKLLGGTRYVILGSFIVAAIITPTPDPLNQLLMAGPIILLYFLSASVIAAMNRSGRRKHKAQAPVALVPAASPRSLPEPAPVVSAVAQTRPVMSTPVRVNDVMVRGRGATIPAYQDRSSASVPIQKKRTRSSPGLISDFVPAAE